MSNLYDLTPATEGYLFCNTNNDQYYVYLTAYSLLDPSKPNGDSYIDVYMLGFNCKRSSPSNRQRYDVKTKLTIIAIFNGFLEQHPDEAFVYICDNKDGLARNRRITFGRWFNEANSNYECKNSHILYGNDNWYSCMIVEKNSPDKERYYNAYYYTLQQMLNNGSEQ